jgi:putative restriction endonuclease
MERENGEIVVAFRPEFLGEYCLSASSLHAGGAAKRDFGLLNAVPELTDGQIEAVPNAERRSVIQQIVRKYRAHDFRRRVLTAYDHRCAACGVQLALIEAAHIEPVSNPGSTDETKNGIALCVLHHAAFDTRLISIDEAYRIQISRARVRQLRSQSRVAGLRAFKENLREVISLPADRRDYPDPVKIVRGREARDWKD